MTKTMKIAISHSLGNPKRDFIKEPLTQQEIEAIIFTYEKELRKPHIEADLKAVYLECVKFLKKYLFFH